MSTGDPYTTGILLITSRTTDRGGMQRERVIGKKSATHPCPWGDAAMSRRHRSCVHVVGIGEGHARASTILSQDV
jgi:hypothetical protein